MIFLLFLKEPNKKDLPSGRPFANYFRINQKLPLFRGVIIMLIMLVI